MSISANLIRKASYLRDQSGHGDPGVMSDLEHVWVEPDHTYGLGFDGFIVYALRDRADDGEEVYMIDLCDMGDIESLRDEAEAANDTGEYEYCVAALDGDLDALLSCVEHILEVQVESAAD